MKRTTSENLPAGTTTNGGGEGKRLYGRRRLFTDYRHSQGRVSEVGKLARYAMLFPQ